MSYSLNSLKGIIYGVTIGVIKGDTRSLDNGSYDLSSAASEVAKLKVELPDCAKVWAPSKHVGVLHTKNPQRDNES